MGARCSACGGSVMSYRSYLLTSRTRATCASCGRPVRLQGHGKLVAAGLAILAALLVAVLLTDSLAAFAAVTVGLAALALAVDYGGYRKLSWAVVPERDRSPRPGGAAPA